MRIGQFLDAECQQYNHATKSYLLRFRMLEILDMEARNWTAKDNVCLWSIIILPLQQILLAQEKEFSQNTYVQVLSLSETAPWQLSYNTDYSFVF